jgi:hypothetical protein
MLSNWSVNCFVRPGCKPPSLNSSFLLRTEVVCVDTVHRGKVINFRNNAEHIL